MASAESTSNISKSHDSARQYVANFVTKSQQWSVPSSPFTLLGTYGTKELNSIVKTLLAECDISDESLNGIEFEFIINNKLFRGSLQKFIELENLNVETQIEIEFIIKEKAPESLNSLLHDDWVSTVDTHYNWVISGCYDATVHIWNLKNNGEHMIAIPAHAAPVKALQWITTKSEHITDANEHLFVTASHDETSIVWKWNEQTNAVGYLHVFRGHSRSVDCIDVHNDLIATGSYDQMLKLWSIASDTDDDGGDTEAQSSKKRKKFKNSDESKSEDKSRVPVLTLSGHTEAISGCAWIKEPNSESDTPNIATCSMDNTIRLWDIEIGECKLILKGSKAYMSIAYSPLNNLLITGSCDRHIRLWDPRSNEGAMVKSAFTSHQSWVSSVHWSNVNEHEFVSGSYDNIVKQWDIRSTNVPLYDLLGHNDKVLCVNWSDPKYIVSGGADNHLKIFASNIS